MASIRKATSASASAALAATKVTEGKDWGM
jgi:hypothetical protein